MQVSSVSTPSIQPGRDLIARLPEYARPAIDSFQATGHLEGENVLRQPIPLDMVPEVEAELTERVGQLMVADETPVDLAPNQPGVVRISAMDQAEPSAWFIGDTREGAVAVDATCLLTPAYAEFSPTAATLAQGLLIMPRELLTIAAYAEFSPTAATLVQVVDTGNEKEGTVAAHIDRQDPAASYLELKDIPEGLLTF